MTREEQKIQREIDFTDWWLREHKMEGAPTYADAIAWADRTMIEKACEWLKDELYDVEDDRQRGGFDIRSKCYFASEDLIEHFKKAMEE